MQGLRNSRNRASCHGLLVRACGERQGGGRHWRRGRHEGRGRRRWTSVLKGEWPVLNCQSTVSQPAPPCAGWTSIASITTIASPTTRWHATPHHHEEILHELLVQHSDIHVLRECQLLQVLVELLVKVLREVLAQSDTVANL